MGKIAFVFPGQGAQFPGMGMELYENSKAAREVFHLAERIRPGTVEMCFHGSPEELSETKNTQPCMFAASLAAAAAAEEAGIHADITAGFSLGEICALVCSGAVDLETGFQIVSKRGELMQEAAEKKSAAMAAVVRLSNGEVEAVCSEFKNVWPVNYNCPGQVSVAGDSGEMAAFSAAVKAAGGRAIPIKVKGGFHSPFMAEAAEKFGKFLENVDISEPKTELYSNFTGSLYSGDAKELLVKQICSPVQWESIVGAMISRGADTFIEMGPGKTLCGFISRIDPDVKAFSLSDMAGLEAVKGELKNV